MSHSMTLKYLTELSPGRYEYRRRVGLPLLFHPTATGAGC